MKLIAHRGAAVNTSIASTAMHSRALSEAGYLDQKNNLIFDNSTTQVDKSQLPSFQRSLDISASGGNIT